MDNMDTNQDKPTNDHHSFGQPPCEEANQLGTPKLAGSNAHFDMESNSPDGGSGHRKLVDNSNDCNNNVSLDDSAYSPISASSHNHAGARSNNRDKQPWVGERFPTLLRAPMKRHAVNRNMDGMNKIRRRPLCGRNLFGIDQDAMVDADGNEIVYQVKRDVSIAPLVDQFRSPKPSEDDNFSFTDVEMSVRPLVCAPLPYMNVSSQCNSSNNSDLDNCHSTADTSNNNSQAECNNAGKDCNNVNDRLVETSTYLTSDDGYSRSHSAGTPSNSPVSNDDDNGNPRGLAEVDSDAEYDRPRLLPEHYVAPRRQRRLPLTIRVRLASMQRRWLSFNSYDDESNNQEAVPEDANLQLSHESSSLHTFSLSSERRLSNQNVRRRLFDSDSNSLEKSFYTITQPHNNSHLSNHFDVATIQSILDTVFGSSCSDNSCPKQHRPHNTSFSDDSEDLGSSDEDCNDVNDSSDNDSSDLSSEEEYVGSTVEGVYFLPKSQLAVFDSDLHSSSLCPVANEDNDNLGDCAVESSDTDYDNSPLYNSADEGCNIVNDSEEETFAFLTPSEDNSRSHVARTPPFSPVTNDNRSNLRAEEDSEAECNRQRCRPVQCAAPRRQRRLPASRRSRPSTLSRRRLCFDDSDDESNNQRAMSEDTSGVSQSDFSIRSRLFSPDNKSLYVLAPSHNQPRQSSQVDIASILSILNEFFNPPSCDKRSSSQYNPPSCDTRSSCQYNPPSCDTRSSCQYNPPSCDTRSSCQYNPPSCDTRSSCQYNPPSCDTRSSCQYNPPSCDTRSSCQYNPPSCDTRSSCQYNPPSCDTRSSCQYNPPSCDTRSSCQYNPPSCDNQSSSQYNPPSCDNQSSSQYNPPSCDNQSSSQYNPPSCDNQSSSQYNPPSCDNQSSSQYNPPSCDNRSSSQYNPSNNSPSENDPNHGVDQPSLATDSSRPSNNDSHDVSEDPEQTESPSHHPSPDNSEDPLD